MRRGTGWWPPPPGVIPLLPAPMSRTPVWNELDDHPDLPPPYGPASWTEDDGAVLIYDRYDVWRFEPATGETTNLTAGAGPRIRHPLPLRPHRLRRDPHPRRRGPLAGVPLQEQAGRLLQRPHRPGRRARNGGHGRQDLPPAWQGRRRGPLAGDPRGLPGIPRPVGDRRRGPRHPLLRHGEDVRRQSSAGPTTAGARRKSSNGTRTTAFGSRASSTSPTTSIPRTSTP